MFPHSYTYNPGVVLDPLTMTPMLTHSGNITVNPLGVPTRPEQKVWQKMFIKNIPQECTNEIMIRLLNEFASIKNFKRTADNRGRLLPFCHFDLQTGQEILRIRRLFINIKMLDQTLQIKISPETENFLKQWTNMQKDEWKKKLQAPGMNEAKEYDTIQHYQLRDDKKYKQRIEDTLRQVNMEVKKLAMDKMRDEERKEHPRQKERQRAKRKGQQELQRTFQQKEDQVLKRQRQKQREYRKEKERERERQKQRLKKIEKEINLDEEEYEKWLSRFLVSQRRKQVQQEQAEDIEIMMEENPPLPQEIPESQPVKRVKVLAEEEIKIGTEKVEGVLVEAPKAAPEVDQKPKELKKNQLFEGYQKLYEQEKQAQSLVQLNIPDLQNEQLDKEQQQKRKMAIKQLQKQVPQTKMQLWQFSIDWVKLSKSVVLQRNIRPWLQQMSNEYMGGVQQKFIALVQKKLLSRSHPDKIIKILKQLLDDDSEEFVIRLWKKLVLEYLKLENGLL